MDSFYKEFYQNSSSNDCCFENTILRVLISFVLILLKPLYEKKRKSWNAFTIASLTC